MSDLQDKSVNIPYVLDILNDRCDGHGALALDCAFEWASWQFEGVDWDDVADDLEEGYGLSFEARSALLDIVIEAEEVCLDNGIDWRDSVWEGISHDFYYFAKHADADDEEDVA